VREEKRTPPRAVHADTAARRQRAERHRILVHPDEHVPRILTGEHGEEREPVRRRSAERAHTDQREVDAALADARQRVRSPLAAFHVDRADRLDVDTRRDQTVAHVGGS
jgi:hypothetical protein